VGVKSWSKKAEDRPFSTRHWLNYKDRKPMKNAKAEEEEKRKTTTTKKKKKKRRRRRMTENVLISLTVYKLM
jgi:hypothetical protein